MKDIGVNDIPALDDKPQTMALWDDISGLPPEETARKSGVSHVLIEGKAVYEIPFFSEPYKADCLKKRLTDASGSPATFQELVCVSAYLKNSFEGPSPGLAGVETSPRELPSGSFFFQGPHVLPTRSLATKFGEDPGAFEKKALSLGAEPHGKNGFKIKALPHALLYFYLDPKDPEFDADARFNFDANILHYLPLDGAWGLANELTVRLLKD
ncbi:MAG: DUF3786 domain-containing protein [Deltaproteobacteria bacterium]|jgi:hypothetical protein|nr:DUF3786 domain-containing protein [Deltaproteobacteria bacterium]